VTTNEELQHTHTHTHTHTHPDYLREWSQYLGVDSVAENRCSWITHSNQKQTDGILPYVHFSYMSAPWLGNRVKYMDALGHLLSGQRVRLVSSHA